MTKYKNAQEWLSYQYPNKDQVEKIELKKLELEQLGELTIEEYPNLKEIIARETNKIIKLTISNCPRLKKININWFKNIQELILHNLPNLEELDCQDNQLTNLSLINCFQIKRFYCSHNKLKTLDLNNCTSLQKLRCSHNFLVKIKLPNAVREKLEVLNLRDNDFSEQDLSFLSYLVNLNELYLGNSDQERIEGNVYNRFYGSLESLKDLNKLESLDISNTDIDSGLEYLPDSIKDFWCSIFWRKEAKCQIFAELLVNSEGEMEISRSVENFSQKLQEYKKMLQNNNLQRTSDFFEKLKNSPSKQKKVNKAKVSNQFENMTVLELSMQKRTKKDQREELFNEVYRQLKNQDREFWLKELTEIKEILETESDEQEHWQNVLQSIKNKLQSQGAKLEIVEELCQIQDEISRLKKKEELEVEKFRQALQVEPTSSKLN